MAHPLKIANCSGFLGDRSSAAREMVEGGPVDVLTGDYLAELTMAILLRQRMRDPELGYAASFLAQMEDVLATCVGRGIKIVANAGGLNPAALAEALRTLAGDLGVEASIATVTGDDLMPELADPASLVHVDTGTPFSPANGTLVTANAYLGGWGIATALGEGADVVVTGRVSDASLVTGPAAWHHGWAIDDWDRLAGAVVAGHVIECGAQATGGNYSFFAEIPGLESPGFPIAEVAEDGSCVITKHPGTGGAVTVGTVTAQLLYEIGGCDYLNPDVVARFDTIRLGAVGNDRVGVSGVRGMPPPPTTKVSAVALAGYRNSMTVVLSGLDIEAKADAVLSALWRRIGDPATFGGVDVRLMRTDQVGAATAEQAMAHLKITVDHPDPARVGREFSNAVVELALASVPGFTVTSPPGRESALVRYWPALVPQRTSIVEADGRRVAVAPPSTGTAVDICDGPECRNSAVLAFDDGVEPEPTIDAPIGRLVGARSGDKGGDANLGVWARSDAAYAWLVGFLTVERLMELLPDTAGRIVERHDLANLRAINFVVRGYLGEGVASSTKWDPQAKTLGEYFRSKVVAIPESLLAG